MLHDEADKRGCRKECEAPQPRDDRQPRGRVHPSDIVGCVVGQGDRGRASKSCGGETNEKRGECADGESASHSDQNKDSSPADNGTGTITMDKRIGNETTTRMRR